MPTGNLRLVFTSYLGAQLAYGAVNLAQDLWHEQVVKRGWTDTGIPSALVPGARPIWLVIVLLAAARHGAAAARRRGRSSRPGTCVAARPTWRALAGAQARLPLGLAAAYDGPVFGGIARVLAGEVREEDTVVAGLPAFVYRPGRRSAPWSAVVLFPGVTRRGRSHPALRAIGRGLAAAGRLAILVEPEGLPVGALTPAAGVQARAAVGEVVSRSDVAGGRVALVGVSGGATLALLSAAERSLADRISLVLALAPLNDVSEAIRSITTGIHLDGGARVRFAPGDFFRLVIARSVISCLEPGDDRTALRSHLLALEDYGREPIAGLRTWPRDGLGEPARAAVALLSNEDPDRFDGLFAGLPDELRASVEALSPLAVAGEIAAPVELVVARHDKYIPLADATSFAKACPVARLTILESLTHVVPTVSPTAVRDLARLDRVLVRLLAAS